MKELEKIRNWVGGKEVETKDKKIFIKFNPHDGKELSEVSDSGYDDVNLAIETAKDAHLIWSSINPVKRGQFLSNIVSIMKEDSENLANIVSIETGKSFQDALGEVNGAIMQAEFFSGEGMRLYGRTLTSGMDNKYSHTVRCPIGIAGLIVPANTPIANLAWKIFPALICGNSVVLKGSEDSPKIAKRVGEIATQAGLPDGVLNIIQGKADTGNYLVGDHRIGVVSFTGSTEVGKKIAESCGKNLTKVSLELGGKNSMIICDDANLDAAVHWASLSAFSNAGQRCASGSRFLIFESVYEEFKDKLISKAESLKLGINEGCDLGPVISLKQFESVLALIKSADKKGSKILLGGTKAVEGVPENGYYIQPTIISNLSFEDDLSQKEIFGPVACLYSIKDMNEALTEANATEYGLTSSIHTKDVDRAMWFAQRVKAGVININIGTYGSEPHMPFGGFGSSGNGTREPGVEALDVYSELKNISFLNRPDLI